VLAVGGGAGSGNSGTIAAGNFGLPIEVATYTIRITFFVRGVIGLVIIYTLMMLIKVGMLTAKLNLKFGIFRCCIITTESSSSLSSLSLIPLLTAILQVCCHMHSRRCSMNDCLLR